MKGAVVWRCFWREYRMARGFWIAMLLLTLGMQSTWYFGNLLGGWNLSSEQIRAMAFVMPLFYVLAWAATAFNREHETGNFALLQGLPLTYLPLWLAKVGFTLISSLLLGAVVMSIAAWLVGVPRDDDLVLIVSIWLLWLVAIAGIGSIVSQWIKRPLTAVFVAGGLLAVAALWPIEDTVGQLNVLNVSGLTVVGLVALGISLPQTRPWLRDQMSWWRDLPVGKSAQQSAAIAKNSRRRTELRRLAWISWRRLGAIELIVLVAVLLSLPFIFESDFESEFEMLAPVMFSATIAWPILLGTTLFYCEQDVTHARFLAGQGVSPTRVWWLRQLIGTLVVAVACVSLLVIYVVNENDVDRKEITVYGLYVLLAYFASQLISITFRSRLVAHAVAALLTLCLAGWIWLFMILGVPLWIGLGIPSATLLLASRLRARPFLLEWNDLRHWWAPAAVLVGGLTASAAAFVTFRVTEIPWVNDPVDIDTFTQLADAKFKADAAHPIHVAGAAISSHRWPSLERYESTTDHSWNALPLPIPPEEQTALAEARELLTPELVQALESAHGLFHSSRWKWSDNTDRRQVGRLGRLFIMRARQRQVQGDLSAAGEDYQNALRVALQLRRYDGGYGWVEAAQLEKLVADNMIFWAAAPGQDPERIASMIAWLVQWWQQEPSWDTLLQVEYTIHSRLVEGFPQSLSDIGAVLSPREAGWLTTLLSLPSERARFRRLLRVQSTTDIASFSAAVRQRMEGWSFALRNDSAKHWQETTPIAKVLSFSGEGMVNLLAEDQLRRTGLLLQLLFIRQQAIEGEYPEPSVEGDLPEQIAAVAQMRLRQVTLGGSNSVPDLDRFYYGRLGVAGAVRRAERSVRFDEPLGSFLVNADGMLAVVVRDYVYPLPANQSGSAR